MGYTGFHAAARNLILGSVFVLSAACGGRDLGTAEKLDLAATPVQTVDKMFVVQSENGVLQMRMEADVMERYQNDSMSYELFPKGLAVFGYNEDGLLETEITADNGRHVKMEKDDSEQWEAYGNVVVRNIIKQEVMEIPFTGTGRTRRYIPTAMSSCIPLTDICRDMGWNRTSVPEIQSSSSLSTVMV